MVELDAPNNTRDSTDDALLIRLNQLRASSVSLDRRRQTLPDHRPSAAGGPGRDGPDCARTVNDVTRVQTGDAEFVSDLVSRFTKLLDNGRPESKGPRLDWLENTSSHDPDDAIEDDDQMIEDLLVEMRAGEASAGRKSDLNEARVLVERARGLLDDIDDASDVPGGAITLINNHDMQAETDGRTQITEQLLPGRDERDEAEADEYIARVLAELDDEHADRNRSARASNSSQDAEPTSPDRPSSFAQNDAILDLPSTPSTLADLTPSSRVKPILPADDELADRFSSLGCTGSAKGPLGLPRAPSFSPSKKPTLVMTGKASSPSAATGPDDDVDSWCCICNEDASVKCLGCDGDLYCGSCWSEGHGMGVGQERGHRAVEYRRNESAIA